MKHKAREALDAYYREAESWANDRKEALQRSRRIAWIVAAAAVMVAVLEALALLALTPLKTVEPYTLLVDRQTGFVQALKPLDPSRVAGDTALTQSLLVQYVIARESFDIDSVQASYRKVALWSAEKARTDYVTSMHYGNVDSPLARYPRSTVIETRVKSVSPVGRNTAMVRFDTLRRDAGGAVRPLRSWVALIRYRFSSAPMSQEDRFDNPLGFEVVRYQRNIETLPAPEQAPEAGGSSPAGAAPALPGPQVGGAFQAAPGAPSYPVPPPRQSEPVL